MQSQKDKPMTRRDKVIAVAIWVCLLWLGIKTGWLQQKLNEAPEILMDVVTSEPVILLLCFITLIASFSLIQKIFPRLDGAYAALLACAGVFWGAWAFGWIDTHFLRLMLACVAIGVAGVAYSIAKERWIEQGRQEERNR